MVLDAKWLSRKVLCVAAATLLLGVIAANYRSSLPLRPHLYISSDYAADAVVVQSDSRSILCRYNASATLSSIAAGGELDVIVTDLASLNTSRIPIVDSALARKLSDEGQVRRGSRVSVLFSGLSDNSTMAMHIAVGGTIIKEQLCNTETGAVLEFPSRSEQYVGSIRDNHFVVSVSNGVLFKVAIFTAETALWRTLQMHGGPSPGATPLVEGGGMVQVAGELYYVDANCKNAYAVCSGVLSSGFSPDGSRLTALVKTGSTLSVYLFDPTCGRALLQQEVTNAVSVSHNALMYSNNGVAFYERTTEDGFAPSMGQLPEIKTFDWRTSSWVTLCTKCDTNDRCILDPYANEKSRSLVVCGSKLYDCIRGSSHKINVFGKNSMVYDRQGRYVLVDDDSSSMGGIVERAYAQIERRLPSRWRLPSETHSARIFDLEDQVYLGGVEEDAVNCAVFRNGWALGINGGEIRVWKLPDGQSQSVWGFATVGCVVLLIMCGARQRRKGRRVGIREGDGP